MDLVQTFINNLDIKWQRDTCQTLLKLQEDVDTSIRGSIKWKNPYFSYNDEALLKWYCAEKWINVYFFKGVRLKDTNHLFETTNNKTMRTIKIFADSKLNTKNYKQLIKTAIKLNS